MGRWTRDHGPRREVARTVAFVSLRAQRTLSVVAWVIITLSASLKPEPTPPPPLLLLLLLLPPLLLLLAAGCRCWLLLLPSGRTQRRELLS